MLFQWQEEEKENLKKIKLKTKLEQCASDFFLAFYATIQSLSALTCHYSTVVLAQMQNSVSYSPLGLIPSHKQNVCPINSKQPSRRLRNQPRQMHEYDEDIAPNKATH